MNKVFCISIFILFFAIYANAQIITDSKNKINKSSKNSRQKINSSKNRNTKSPFSIRDKSKRKQYSSSGQKPFSNFKFIKPSFTPSNLKFSGHNKFKPALSTGNPFRGKNYTKNIYFSPSNPFRGMNFKKKIYFSPSNPFRGMNFKKKVYFSPSNPFRGMSFTAKPRFSPSNPFRGMNFKKKVYFSPSNPFRGMSFKVKPRFSPSNPFGDADLTKTVRFTSLDFSEKFYTNERIKNKRRPKNPTSDYIGEYKYKFTRYGKPIEVWSNRKNIRYNHAFSPYSKNKFILVSWYKYFLGPRNVVADFTGNFKTKFTRYGKFDPVWSERKKIRYKNAFNSYSKGKLFKYYFGPRNVVADFTGNFKPKFTRYGKFDPVWSERKKIRYKNAFNPYTRGKLFKYYFGPRNVVADFTGKSIAKHKRHNDSHYSWRYKRNTQYQNSLTRNLVKGYDKTVSKLSTNKTLSKEGSKKAKKAKFDRKEHKIWNN